MEILFLIIIVLLFSRAVLLLKRALKATSKESFNPLMIITSRNDYDKPRSILLVEALMYFVAIGCLAYVVGHTHF